MGQPNHNKAFPEAQEESCVKDLLCRSRESNDSGIEVNIQPDNNETDNASVNNELINVDDSISIYPGSDVQDSKLIGDNTNESFIDVEDDGDKKADVARFDNPNHGLNILAEGIECMEKGTERPKRKARYASTDCCEFESDSLQILCDVANMQTKRNIESTDLKIKRSTSLDSYNPRIDKTDEIPTVQKDLRVNH